MERHSDDSEYFVTTILPHYDYIRKFIFTIAESDNYAMDIVQDTMLLAWKNLDKLRKYKNVRNGLVTMARHAFTDYYRKHREGIDFAEMSELKADCLTEPDIAEFLIELEYKSEFFAEVNVLKGNQLKIVLLYYYFDMSMKEIARVLRLNYNTVVSLHKRALALMRKKYEQRKKETGGDYE